MTPTPPVTLVAFDLDGVLYDFTPARRATYLAQLTGCEPAWIQHVIWDSDFERAAEAGEYPTGETYLRAFNERLRVPVSRDQWIAARRSAMAPRPRMLAVLESLRSRVELAVLTNNGALVRDTLPDLVPELWALLGDRIRVTADLGARKPDPVVFQRLAAAHDRPPAAVVFVDDNLGNVQGARAAGLQSFHFESEDQFEWWLPALSRCLP
jgi:HAD superfamily hydrolase (TIGR01509 family)